jgi:menaquinone-9 beta-reductase
MSRPKLIRWVFNHYLDIAPPSFALEGARPFTRAPALPLAA